MQLSGPSGYPLKRGRTIMAFERTMDGMPNLGAHVWTVDGDDLGVIKEIQGRYFKVDASMQPDYWLPTDCIRTASAQRVELSMDKDHVGDFKVKDPTKP
jgi:hypothetical protein